MNEQADAQSILQEEIEKSEASQELTTYIDNSFGIELKYPGSWQKVFSSESTLILENLESRGEEFQIEKVKKTSETNLDTDWFLAEDFPYIFDSTELKPYKVGEKDAVIHSVSNTIIVNEDTFYYTIQNGVGMERNTIDKEVYFAIVDSIIFNSN